MFEPTVVKAINSFPSGSWCGPSLLRAPVVRRPHRKEQRAHRQRVPPEANKRSKYCLRGQTPCRVETFSSSVLNLLAFGKKTVEFDQLRLETRCVEYAQNV